MHKATHTGFRLPRTCLPKPGTDLHTWAVIACDPYTAEPAYWQRVKQRVAGWVAPGERVSVT